jgi:hypothetical protein
MTEALLIGSPAQFLDRPVVGALVNFAAVIVAILAIRNASHSFKRQLQNINYTEIDRIYFELQSLKLTCWSDAHRDELSRKAFNDTYSLLLWNFIESIHDRCEDVGKVKGDKQLFETWKPIIEYEGNRNKDWFFRDGNAEKFKPCFRKWVEKRFSMTDA